MNQKSINFVEYCTTGNVDAVEEILKDETLDVNVMNGSGLRLASQKGYFEIVKLLLEDGRIDPSVQGNYSLKWSLKNEFFDTTRLLMDDTRCLGDAKGYYEFYKINELRIEKLNEQATEFMCGLWTLYIFAISLILL